MSVRFWVGPEVFYRDSEGFVMEGPILEPFHVLIFGFPLALYPCRQIPSKLRIAGAIVSLLLLGAGILLLTKWIYMYSDAEIPPRWADNRWLRQTIVDPTFVPVLLLFLGCAVVCELMIRGRQARLRFSVGELLVVTLLLSVCLVQWQFMSTVLPRILEPDRFDQPAN